MAGWRDRRDGVAPAEEDTSGAASNWLFAQRAEVALRVSDALRRAVPTMKECELELRTCKGSYAEHVGALPAPGALEDAERVRCDALAALSRWRGELDAVRAVFRAQQDRYDLLAHSYLRAARADALKVPPCECNVGLEEYEDRYRAYDDLMLAGYFDRHH